MPVRSRPESRPHSRPERLQILVAYAAFLLVGLNAGVSGVLLPAQIQDYGVDKATIGIIFFTGSAGFVLAGLSNGALIHRLGPRVALVLGGSAFVLAGGAIATRPPFLAFVAIQVLVGYGMGVLESVLNVCLSALSGATTLLNRLHAFFGVGALLGPLLATWVLGLASWTAVWVVLAGLGIPLTLGFATVFPRHDPAEAAGAPGPGPGNSPGTSDSPGSARTGLLAATLRDRGVLLGTALLAVYVGLEIGLGNWGFSYLVEEHGQSDALAGYTVSGYWLGLTLGRFLISPLATRLGRSPVSMIYTCLTAIAVVSVATGLLPLSGASLGFVLIGFFLGPIFPTTIALMPESTAPRLVPTAIGVMNAGSIVGGSVLPWLAGALAQGIGVWTLLPFAAVLALVQLVIWWRMAQRIRLAPASAPA